ncbi:DUF2793 domain-containing protein [Pseudaminobacter arsenicus]|uniref:DUF2793 domain-containing protein n=1 Tax=Borborobacter arsenicus TaxID=1851146 RepID=A0A432V9P5_9HYPH|nr:DUF2793 domain-containing protein [Pseudaminobacter arsenicus]RUM98890.1 DUF2793 domain-containing protein [Pseudaminobacter arsenicus]
MESSANLTLPYIMPSQAQKHVTHNEALDLLDAVVQLAVVSRTLTAPAGGESDGDRYIVAAAAVGDWQGKDGMVAVWRDGGWNFLAPLQGWLAWVIDEAIPVYWGGSAWERFTNGSVELQNLTQLGLGTTADGLNPFSAKLNKALWTALAVADGGDGDLRYTMNKEGASNVLSLLLQSGFSGRAEIGLVGDNDLAIKVSSDGANWKQALKINRSTGRISSPNILSDFAVSLLPDSGRFAGNGARDTAVGAFAFPAYLTLYNGATVATFGKYITNNNDYGGTGGALAPEIKNLVDTIRDPASRRYGVEFHVAQITVGAGTATTPVVLGGTSYFLSTYLTDGPRVPMMTFHVYVRALDAPIVYRWYPGQTFIKNGVASNNHVVISPADGWVSMTVLDEQSPRSNAGYQPMPCNINAATAGNRYLLACPALMGGITQVDDNVGVIAGFNRWLA